MAPQIKEAINLRMKRSLIKTKETNKEKTIGSSTKKGVQPKIVDKTPFKANSMTPRTRQRTCSLPKIETPKAVKVAKENITAPKTPKSASKPSWKRRPMPAHSGVPVPEKMKKMMLALSRTTERNAKV